MRPKRKKITQGDCAQSATSTFARITHGTALYVEKEHVSKLAVLFMLAIMFVTVKSVKKSWRRRKKEESFQPHVNIFRIGSGVFTQ
jgi:hypothetical protein